MNIKLRLAEEGELEAGAVRGPTLELVLEKDGVVLEDEMKESGGELSTKEEQQQQENQEQICRTETDREDLRTELFSADSSLPTNSQTEQKTNP